MKSHREYERVVRTMFTRTLVKTVYRHDKHERDRITLNIRTDLLESLNDIAGEYDTSVSSVVEEALVKTFDEDGETDYSEVRLLALQAEREQIDSEIDALEEEIGD